MIVAVAPMEQVQGFDRDGKLVRVARHDAPRVQASRLHPDNRRKLEQVRIRSLTKIADVGAHHARLLPLDGDPIEYTPAELALYRTPEGAPRVDEA